MERRNENGERYSACSRDGTSPTDNDVSWFESPHWGKASTESSLEKWWDCEEDDRENEKDDQEGVVEEEGEEEDAPIDNSIDFNIV